MLFKSSPVIQVQHMNGVSDITFPRPLSTQDKHICRMVIAAKIKKGKREGRKERRKRGKDGNIKESTTNY